MRGCKCTFAVSLKITMSIGKYVGYVILVLEVGNRHQFLPQVCPEALVDTGTPIDTYIYDVTK